MNHREDRINYAIQRMRLHMARELEKSVDDIPDRSIREPFESWRKRLNRFGMFNAKIKVDELEIFEPKEIKPEITREDWIKGNFPKGTKVLVV